MEVRHPDGSWPLGPWWSPGFEPQLGFDPFKNPGWQDNLEEGSLLDAYDSTLRTWIDGEVMQVTRPLPALAGILNLPARADQLTVHFRGWSRGAAGMASFARGSHDLQPLHCKTKPWRQGVRLGDEIEVARVPAQADPAALQTWFVGRVADLDFTVEPPTLTVVYCSFQPPGQGVAAAAGAGAPAPVPVPIRVIVSLEDSTILAPHITHGGDGSGRRAGGMHVRMIDYPHARVLPPADAFAFPLPGVGGVPPLPPPWTKTWKP